MFAGSLIPIITPFKNGAIDEKSFLQLIECHIAEGTDGIIPCGTTGESATLSHLEHEKLIDICVQAVNHRVPVIAGTGSNNTCEAVKLTRYAKTAGADGALLITPYYNRPTQEGLYQHYRIHLTTGEGIGINRGLENPFFRGPWVDMNRIALFFTFLFVPAALHVSGTPAGERMRHPTQEEKNFYASVVLPAMTTVKKAMPPTPQGWVVESETPIAPALPDKMFLTKLLGCGSPLQ